MVDSQENVRLLDAAGDLGDGLGILFLLRTNSDLVEEGNEKLGSGLLTVGQLTGGLDELAPYGEGLRAELVAEVGHLIGGLEEGHKSLGGVNLF